MSLLTLQGAIGIIFAFSVAIFVHELGHFMFAKLFRVKVETFSIGFGKRIWGFKRGDTEYKIAMIPFGGYVKMVGTLSKEMEDVLEGEKPATEEEREVTAEAAAELSAPAPVSMAEGIQDEVNALRNKAYWQKLLVFAAGCINNVITAIVIFFLVNWIGYHVPPPTPAELAGVEYISEEASPLKEGDKIVAVDGKPVAQYVDFATWYAEKEKATDFKGPVRIMVERGGTTVPVELPLTVPGEPALPAGEIVSVAGNEVESAYDAATEALKLLEKEHTAPADIVVKTDSGTTTVKASPIVATGPWWPSVALRAVGPPRISMLMPNLPAEKSGLKSGDMIVSIDDQPVSSSYAATRILRSMPGETAQLLVERKEKDGSTGQHKIGLEVRPNPDNKKIGQIGVGFGADRTELRKYSFKDAWSEAFTRTWAMVTGYIEALERIFGSSFMTIRENLSGPIGISVQFYKVAQAGWFDFFVTFAFFNVVLAMTNLLPLPVLDGGHILFATIEAIIRRPLPAKVMVGIYNLFTFLIIGLALVITFNDLIMNAWRLIGK